MLGKVAWSVSVDRCVASWESLGQCSWVGALRHWGSRP